MVTYDAIVVFFWLLVVTTAVSLVHLLWLWLGKRTDSGVMFVAGLFAAIGLLFVAGNGLVLFQSEPGAPPFEPEGMTILSLVDILALLAWGMFYWVLLFGHKTRAAKASGLHRK